MTAVFTPSKAEKEVKTPFIPLLPDVPESVACTRVPNFVPLL
jgi:hypothetical protein